MSVSKDTHSSVQLRMIENRYGVNNINCEILAGADRARWVWWKTAGGTWHSVETDRDFDKALPVLIAAIRLTA